MLFIPIGVDCGVANTLKSLNLRKFSLPFDWTVTYNMVFDCIKDNFENFFCIKNDWNETYFTKHVHDKVPEDNEKYNRRIKRFQELLTSDEELVFIRKGHAVHHHQECDYFKNEIEECKKLQNYLKENYKDLKFTILLFIVCNKCYSTNEIPDNLEELHIFNVITNTVNDLAIENIIKVLYAS